MNLAWLVPSPRNIEYSKSCCSCPQPDNSQVDPVASPMVVRLIDLYATGAHTLSTLRMFLKTEYGKIMSLGDIHLILKNKFYLGTFEWVGEKRTGPLEGQVTLSFRTRSVSE
jgi:hypothetical protein